MDSLALFTDPDRDALAEDVVFSSPFADYHGAADVAHLLSLISDVLEAPVATSTAFDGAAQLTVVRASVDGHALEGVLRDERDPAGRVRHATLFLRPYASLRVAMAAMGERLAASPLPSAGA